MPDASHSEDEPFVVEPVEQLDGVPAPPARRLRLAHQLQHHRLPGVVALAEGLALFGLFGLAPWFSWRQIFFGDLHWTPQQLRYLMSLAADHNYSGWAVTQGVPMGYDQFTSFAPLWLIPLAAAALLVLGWLHMQRRLPDRTTLLALLALSALTLLAELSFLPQVHNLQVTNGDVLTVSVSWGFWGAAGVNAAAAAVEVVLLKPALPRPHALPKMKSECPRVSTGG